jgi:hypothetical protein
MATKVGKFASVYAGTYKVAEIGEFTVSGFSRDALEVTAFGDDIKKYIFGLGDSGEITFKGHYDPTDSTGQTLLDSACKNSSTLSSAQLKFYIDSTSYICLGSGGTWLVTKCNAVAFDKAGVGTIDFTVKCSGAALTII